MAKHSLDQFTDIAGHAAMVPPVKSFCDLSCSVIGVAGTPFIAACTTVLAMVNIQQSDIATRFRLFSREYVDRKIENINNTTTDSKTGPADLLEMRLNSIYTQNDYSFKAL